MYTTILHTPTARLLTWTCGGHHRHWGDVEFVDRPEIVVPLGGVFVRESASRELLATPLTAAFANRGDEYRVRHPVEGGDRGVAVVLSDEGLEGLARAGYFPGSREPRLPEGAGQISPRLALKVQVLLRRPTGTHRLALDELAADLTAEALSRTRRPPRRRNRRTGSRQTAAVARGLEFIASSYRRAISVDDVARAAAYSMFHFSRIFRQETGFSIHRYVLVMRLREAAKRVLEGEDNLSALAYELGFSSHSHFTSAFTREYALAPSLLRRLQGPGDLPPAPASGRPPATRSDAPPRGIPHGGRR